MSDRFDHTLEHKLKTKPEEPEGDEAVAPMRRIELMTGGERRRRWSEDEKARIIVESLRPGANVSAVARRHGVSPQQLFGWRRVARELFSEDTSASPPARALEATGCAPSAPSTMPAFTPVVLAVPPEPAPAGGAASPPSGPSTNGRIEIAIGEMIVRVVGPVETGQLTAVLRAVRRAS